MAVSPPWCWGLRRTIEGCSLTHLVFGCNCAYSKEPLVCLSHRASPACHLPSRRFRVLRVQVPRERDRWNQITFYDVASEASSSLPITFYCEDNYTGMPGLEVGTRTLPLMENWQHCIRRAAWRMENARMPPSLENASDLTSQESWQVVGCTSVAVRETAPTYIPTPPCSLCSTTRGYFSSLPFEV